MFGKQHYLCLSRPVSFNTSNCVRYAYGTRDLPVVSALNPVSETELGKISSSEVLETWKSVNV